MKNKFDYYDVVQIVPNVDVGLRELAETRGCVLGMAFDEDNQHWSYAVSLDSNSEVWNVSEENLVETGERRKRSDYYPGDSARVRVDPETGEGSLGQ